MVARNSLSSLVETMLNLSQSVAVQRDFSFKNQYFLLLLLLSQFGVLKTVYVHIFFCVYSLQNLQLKSCQRVTPLNPQDQKQVSVVTWK